MKLKFYLLTAALLIGFTNSILAQMPMNFGAANFYYPSGFTDSGLSPIAALNSGSITSLDNVQAIAILFSYSELKVGMGLSEPEFLNKMSKEVNQKQPGEGDRIKNEWEGYKKLYYEPAFTRSFNNICNELKLGMKGTNSTSENFTMLVNVLSIAPGSVIKSSNRAFIDVEYIFKNTADSIICKYYVKNAVGYNTSTTSPV